MLTIKRIKCNCDITRKYKVNVDGKEVCSLKNGEEKSLNLENGKHIIKVTIDWCSSNEIEFNYTQNQNLIFLCHSSQKNKGAIAYLKNLTINKDSYITLYQDLKA